MNIKELTQTSDSVYDLWLSLIPHVGSIKAQKLIKAFSTSKNLYFTSDFEIRQKIHDSKISDSIIKSRKRFNFKKVLAELRDKKISFMSFSESKYPSTLLTIRDFPLVLYYKGDSSLFNHNMFSIVGSRRYSEYGKLICQKFVSELSNQFVIVSGMAFGIDSLAHKYTLENEGQTIAVLGSGVDVISPASNRKIYNQIIDNNGLVISEYSPGTLPSKGAFPRRNRIISGLSKGVLIVEASKRSGSLITAFLALEQGREVFAIPHSVFSTKGYGTNELIKKSEAKLVQNIEDILVELQIEEQKLPNGIEKKEKDLSEIEKSIVKILKEGGRDFDQLSQATSENIESILETLLSLEMKGYVVEEASGIYRLVK